MSQSYMGTHKSHNATVNSKNPVTLRQLLKLKLRTAPTKIASTSCSRAKNSSNPRDGYAGSRPQARPKPHPKNPRPFGAAAAAAAEPNDTHASTVPVENHELGTHLHQSDRRSGEGGKPAPAPAGGHPVSGSSSISRGSAKCRSGGRRRGRPGGGGGTRTAQTGVGRCGLFGMILPAELI